MRQYHIFVFILLIVSNAIWSQKTKLFYDASGVQGSVMYTGLWQDSTLPQSGKYELKWRSQIDGKLNTYYASGNLKNATPNGKWLWEQGIWDYSIQPGKTLAPELNLRGERKSWDANFKDGKAQGAWKYTIDSLPSTAQSKKEYLQIISSYENGCLSGKITVRDTRPLSSFLATADCDKFGVARGIWSFEYLKNNVRFVETRKYDSGILIELSIFTIEGSDTLKSLQKFDENIEKLNLLKNGASALNFKIGDQDFESDGYETDSKLKFIEYFEGNFLKAWSLPIFKAQIERRGPIFRKIQYPISTQDNLMIARARKMSDSLHIKIQKRKAYTNIQLNRGRSVELDVAVEFLHLVERRVKSVDSLLSAAERPAFTYINRFSDKEMNLEATLNADTMVRSRFYKQAFVLFPFFKFDTQSEGLFGSLNNYLMELDALSGVHFMEMDYSYQRLQKEGELLAIENLLAQRLLVLDSVYAKCTGLAETIHKTWTTDYIRGKFQHYSNQDDYVLAKKLATDLLGKMDTLLLWHSDWAKIDSMSVLLKDQYTVFEYNPYNGKHDIEIRLKRRFYNKISTQVLPWVMADFSTEKVWENFVYKKKQLEEANAFLIRFAKENDKNAQRLEQKIKRENSTEKIVKILSSQ